MNAVKRNQPRFEALIPGNACLKKSGDAVLQFQTVLESIGANVHLSGDEDPGALVVRLFPDAKRIVATSPETIHFFADGHQGLQPATLHDVDVAIISVQFGVAENGAVWVTEEDLKVRVLPFICEHLVAIVKKDEIVWTMQEAYARIGMVDYGFGGFIAGPSKTADIEQSLVLGAHGPKSMTVLIRS